MFGASATRSRTVGGTDSTAFNNAGLPGIGFGQDPIEYSSHTHHTNLDNYERIIESDVKTSAIVDRGHALPAGDARRDGAAVRARRHAAAGAAELVGAVKRTSTGFVANSDCSTLSSSSPAASSVSASSRTRRTSRASSALPVLDPAGVERSGGGVALLGGFVWAELGSRFPHVGGQYVYLQRAYPSGRRFSLRRGAALHHQRRIAGRGGHPVRHLRRSLLRAARPRRGSASVAALALIDPHRGEHRRRARGKVDEQHADGGEGGRNAGAARARVQPRHLAGKRVRSLADRSSPSERRSSCCSRRWCRSCSRTAAGRVARTLAAEIKDPARNLPRANVLGVIVVITLYLSLNVAYLWVADARSRWRPRQHWPPTWRGGRRRRRRTLRRAAHRGLEPRLSGVVILTGPRLVSTRWRPTACSSAGRTAASAVSARRCSPSGSRPPCHWCC